MLQAAGKGHSVLLSNRFCRGERPPLARVVPYRASSRGPTSSIPHDKSLLGEDCSLWWELSAAGVEGVAGFLA